MSTRDPFGFAWQLAVAPWRLGISVSRDAIDEVERARGALTDSAERVLLQLFDEAERARSALTDSAERLLLQLLDDVMRALTDEQVVDRLLARIEETDLVQRVAQHMLAAGMVEQIAERLLSGPEMPRMLRSAFETELPDEVVAQLLASEAVWVLVDEIVSSPAVMEAVTQQGVGFAEQVGGKARDRSREADARLQRLAGRFRRERHLPAPTHEGGAPISGHAGGEGTR